MQFYALIYHVVEDYIVRRAQYRDEHLRLAIDAYKRGELVLGGAYAEPADQALLVWRVADKSVIDDFVNEDPYVKNGVVTKWEIRLWKVAVGQDVFD